MGEIEYTIAVTTYNMAATLPDALRSIREQIDSRFEVVVIDDGSTDATPRVLAELAAEDDRLRWRRLEPDPTRHLGQTRNISVAEARGDHVILHLDADDTFRDGAILDLVYECLREARSSFALTAAGATVAPRSFLRDRGPYRNLPVGGEDLDLWRRLLAADELVWIRSDDMAEEIGYEKRPLDKLRRWYQVAVADLRAGITLPSYYAHAWRHHSPIGLAYFAVMLPVAYLRARRAEQYDCPDSLRHKGSRHRQLERQKRTLIELEADWGISVDRDRLSPAGRELFHVQEEQTPS